MIIGDERPLTVDNKILAREVIQEKTPDGKKKLRIILMPRTLRGGKEILLQATGLLLSRDRSDRFLRPVRPVLTAGQTALVVSPGPSS